MSSRSRAVAAVLAVLAAVVPLLVSLVHAGSAAGPAPTVSTTTTTTSSTTSTTRAPFTKLSVPAATSPSEPRMTPSSEPDTVSTKATTLEPAASGTLDPHCAAHGHSALVDRKRQRTWLCTDGRRGPEMPATTAWSMPDPGTYHVYAKDLNATSTFGGHFSRMTHFVAFSYGKRTKARVAFHSLPVLNNGQFVQPLDSVGDLRQRGESNGCIRVRPDDAVAIWDHLAIGDAVIVLN